MEIKKVSSINEAIECDKLLTKLIREEALYNNNIDKNYEVKDWFTNIYSDESKGLFVSIIDEKVVGYIYVKTNVLDQLSINKMDAIIDGLYVLEEYRNKKIATMLIEQVKDWCIEKNISSISLNVLKENKIARDLYYKFGFKEMYINLKCQL